MTASEIRKLFLGYFKKHGHTVVVSSSLVPKGDPTLLFTNAGMVPFKTVFTGEETRTYKRASSSQKCMRAGGKHNDLENVGRTARHHTFFEMLGNFSFGDYFKREAIRFAWDFITKEAGIDKNRLWATVFREDDEASDIWEKETGISKDRIVRLGEKDNFWAMGDTGPCGPCSEIIIDQGEDVGCGRKTCKVGCDCDRFLEIWNLVFMQYNRDLKGRLTPLPKPSIDTGMGLERLTAVIQGKKSNYDTDLFMPIIKYIEGLCGKKYGADEKSDVSMRVIADHSRACAFLITDGVMPSNEGRGYVLRRIIRRASRHGKALGLKEPFLFKAAGVVIDIMSEAFPQLKNNEDTVKKALQSEEERFLETLGSGMNILETEVSLLKKKSKNCLSGDIAFKLYDTYGFPLDLTVNILEDYGISVDESGFNHAMEEQRLKARETWKGSGEEKTAVLYKNLSLQAVGRELPSGGISSKFVGYNIDAFSTKVRCIIKDGEVVQKAGEDDKVEIIVDETPFYGESGGQIGDIGRILGKGFIINVIDTKKPLPDLIVHYTEIKEGEIKTRDEVEMLPDIKVRKAVSLNHTATHIMHTVLRKTLGTHIRQSGSLVTAKRLRFDFNHFSALTDDEIKLIEDDVNAAIRENFAVSADFLPYQEAIDRGAIAFFDEKYGDVVRLVDVGGFSKELCGGIHVRHSGEIGLFKIISESSVAAGIRRIEGVTGDEALNYIREEENILCESASILKTTPKELVDRINRELEGLIDLEKEIEKLKARLSGIETGNIMDKVKTVSGVKVLAERAAAESIEDMREMADRIRQKMGSGVVVLGAEKDGKVMLLAAVTKDLTSKYNAGNIIKEITPIIGGKGGGRPDIAQGGGDKPEKLDEALKRVWEMVGG
ncbi:MAG TPA: alanine--tRNA ligase [Deltaproteobacteria bacterium]|nr:alanine--tRNA ligase [Deltaproteobacteria bacterium]